MDQYRGRATFTNITTETVQIPAPRSVEGFVLNIAARKSSGSGTVFSWALYSENPADLPAGTELAEYLIAAGLNINGEDNRATCLNDAAVPDLNVSFGTDLAWVPKSSAAVGSLWLVITFDAGVDNDGWVAVVAQPDSVTS